MQGHNNGDNTMAEAGNPYGDRLACERIIEFVK